MTALVASVLFAAAAATTPTAPATPAPAAVVAQAPRPAPFARVRGARLLEALRGARGELERVLSPTADTVALAAALACVRAAPASEAQDVLAAGARDGGPREREVLGIGAVAAESARAEFAGLGTRRATAPLRPPPSPQSASARVA